MVGKELLSKVCCIAEQPKNLHALTDECLIFITINKKIHTYIHTHTHTHIYIYAANLIFPNRILRA